MDPLGCGYLSGWLCPGRTLLLMLGVDASSAVMQRPDAECRCLGDLALARRPVGARLCRPRRYTKTGRNAAADRAASTPASPGNDELGALPSLDALKVCKNLPDLPRAEAEIGHVRMTHQDASGKRLWEAGHLIPLGECAQWRGGEIPARVATSNRMAADALQLDNPPPGVNLLRARILHKDALVFKAGFVTGVRQAGCTTCCP